MDTIVLIVFAAVLLVCCDLGYYAIRIEDKWYKKVGLWIVILLFLIQMYFIHNMHIHVQ